MDNLKWYWVYVPYLDPPERQQESALKAGYSKVCFKDEADKVIANKDEEIAGLKAIANEPGIPSRPCRKCGSIGTLIYMPIVKNEHTYWRIYHNKGIDYVVGIRCAHCGEVAFVTKQTHEYELRHHKYKRCLTMALWCNACLYQFPSFGTPSKKEKWWSKWHDKWLDIAEEYK